ncbi:MAG: hypothetical protein IK038_08515 [Bacteroidaceae bacterium]|nr:hypothetical protein [Bacteroidaceae bacterium]
MAPVIKDDSKGLSGLVFRLLPYVLAAVLFILLLTCGQYYLKKVEDLSIFMFDWLYFKDAIKIPAGFLGVAGAFCTQFLFYPWLGAIIWIFILLTAYQLTIRALKLPQHLQALAIIPVALLVISNMSLGYGVFIMREQDHFFAPLLGYIVSLIPLFAVRRIQPVWGRIILLVLWTAIGYPLFGTFALVGTLSASCLALIEQGRLRNDRLTVFTTGLALIILVPIISYNFFTSYRLADGWRLGLPTISDEVWNRPMRAPIQLALLFIPAMAVVSRWFKDKGTNLILNLSVYLAAVIAVWGFWYKDDNFQAELAMSEAVDRFDWNEVINIYKKTTAAHARSDAKAYAARTKKLAGVKDQNVIDDIVERYDNRFFEPTRTMVLYRDLALLKLNRALDEAFLYKDGGRAQNSRTQIPMAFQSGKQLYLQYGLVNMSYRWCLEDIIENNWSYSTLKYLVMHCNIMNETDFAYKYINKLRKTVFYRKWADEQLVLSRDSALMASSKPYNEILPYMCFEDHMTNDMVKSEVFLINHFLGPEPVHPTPEYDRAALFFSMRIQDIPRFWERLLCYVNTNDFTKLPHAVQEAVVMYSSLEKKTNPLPVDDKIKESYDAFNRYVQGHPIRSMKESAYPYSQKYGKTFYYYYYFIRNLQTY